MFFAVCQQTAAHIGFFYSLNMKLPSMIHLHAKGETKRSSGLGCSIWHSLYIYKIVIKKFMFQKLLGRPKEAYVNLRNFDRRLG